MVSNVVLLSDLETALTFVCIHGEVCPVNLVQGKPSILLQANLLLHAVDCLPEVKWGAVVFTLLAEKLTEAFQVGRVMEYLLEGPEEQGKRASIK